jgi:hypothetical protein
METIMRKSMITGLILGTGLMAFGGQAHAYVNYPWCVRGDGRGMECVFSTKEQCAMDGRNRGFGGTCMQNPFYDPTKGRVVESAAAKPLARGKK